MATIAQTTITGGDAVALTETTLDGSSDTFTYINGARQVLTFRNPTGDAISPTIDGDGASTVDVDGVGSVDISSGYSVGSIAAGEAVAIQLDSIKRYLAGTITISSGSGLVATLIRTS